MDFNPQQFFDDLSRNYNVFDERNAINQGVTQAWKSSPLGQGFDAIGTAFAGGPTAADAKPLTPAEIMQLIQNNPGLTQTQLQQFMADASPGNGRTGFTRATAEDAIAKYLHDNALDSQGADADAMLGRYLADLHGTRDAELAAIDEQAGRLERIVKDPNQIRTDAEYGAALRQAETALQASRAQARNQGASIAATRGSGFSGAGLGLARAADTNAVNEYGRIEGNALSDVGGKYYGTAANPGGIKSFRAGRANAYNEAESGATNARNSFKTSIIGQKAGYQPTFNFDQFTSSASPKLYSQSESERAANQYLFLPFQQFGDNMTAIASNGANQIGSIIKK